MAISNFGELKAELTKTMMHPRFADGYVNRTLLFEAAANRRLRVRQMEALRSITISSATGAQAIPADYLAWRSVLWTDRTPFVEIDYVHPAYLQSTTAGSDGGDPRIFTIEASTFYARPVSGSSDTYEFHYYQKIPTITTGDATTNWLITDWPDAYLFGVLAELFALGRNIEGAQLYKARRDEVFAKIIQLSALTTGATSPQVRQSEYF